MAYTEPVIIAALRFADRPGLTINTKEPTAAQWEEKIAPLLVSSKEDPLQWIDVFVDCLDSWDLTYKDGSSVPATRAGLMSHSITFVQQIVRQWMSHGLVFKRDNNPSPSTQEPQEVSLPKPDPFAGISVQALDLTPDTSDSPQWVEQ